MTIARTLNARVAVMGHGVIQFDGAMRALEDNRALVREWLAVGGSAVSR
jgi:branched-chain amino acid transport system ATP-binding protein